jgi:7-cyano-7-deazaguanine synthase
MKVVVLLSGGVDSVTALHHAGAEHDVLAAVSFDYGAKHNRRELPCAERQAAKLGVPHVMIPLRFIGELFQSDLLETGGAVPDGHYAEASMKRTVVPFRNGIMLAVACGYAESVEATGVVIAAHAGDHAIYPDCREPFMAGMARAMEEGTYTHVQLLRPFIGWDKAAIVRRGHELGVDFAHTWSCYKGREIHCGTCGTCVERKEAFSLAGVPDPTRYLQ